MLTPLFVLRPRFNPRRIMRLTTMLVLLFLNGASLAGHECPTQRNHLSRAYSDLGLSCAELMVEARPRGKG